jgi:cellulose biosynthesis protein BcsS
MRMKWKDTFALWMVVMLIGMATSVPCRAASVEGIAGWEGDVFEQGYGFLTAGILFPENEHLTFLTRLAGSYLYYNYVDSAGEVRVRAPGVAGQCGVRTGRESWDMTLLAGADIRWEKRRMGTAPEFGSAVAKGGATVQGEANVRLGARFKPSFLVNYSGSARYTYGRALFPWQCNNLSWTGPISWFAGVEAIGQGNYESDAVQVGGVLQAAFVHPGFSLSLRGGFKNASSSQTSRRQGGYLGVGFYRRF